MENQIIVRFTSDKQGKSLLGREFYMDTADNNSFVENHIEKGTLPQHMDELLEGVVECWCTISEVGLDLPPEIYYFKRS